MPCRDHLIWAALVCLLLDSDAWAQVRPFAELRDSLDETAVKRYLDEIDVEIGKISTEYPQLANWNVPKGRAWSDPGKKATPSSLEYAHSRVSPKPAALVDQFGANGFQLEVRVISQKAMALLSGAGIGGFVFGRPLAGGCVIAHMLMADPKSPKNVALAIRVAGIVRKSLPERSCM